MSQTETFEYAQKQSGVLGEEVAGQQGQGQIRQSGIAEDGVESGPRVGTRTIQAGEGDWEAGTCDWIRAGMNPRAQWLKPASHRVLRESGLLLFSPMIYLRAGYVGCGRWGGEWSARGFATILPRIPQRIHFDILIPIAEEHIEICNDVWFLLRVNGIGGVCLVDIVPEPYFALFVPVAQVVTDIQ